MRSENQARQLIREQAARAGKTAPVRLAFLGDVSTALATSLEYEATLEKLPRLAVPFLADWCVNEALAATTACPSRTTKGARRSISTLNSCPSWSPCGVKLWTPESQSSTSRSVLK
jgi:hypothetical protein